MEKENKLLENGLGILDNMEEKDFRAIKSGIGLVELSCTIVEESYNRLKKASLSINNQTAAPWKIKGIEKKETAVLLLTPLLQKIKENIENSIIDFLSRESTEDTIDDLVVTWKENLVQITYKCMWIIKLFTRSRENETRLARIKV